MRCKQALGRLSAYIDGELTLGEEEELRDHLDHCRACAGEQTRLTRTLGLLQSLPEEDPGEAFNMAVMARIRRADETPAEARPSLRERLERWLTLWPAPRPALGVAAALVLGLAVGAGLHQFLGGAPSAERSAAGEPALMAQQPGAVEGAEIGTPGGGPPAAAAANRPGRDTTGVPAPEFVLDPYVMHEGPRQVAVPVFPREWDRGSPTPREDDAVTF
ncbi:MAG: hypothetical protein GF355_12780 [Candidatus Eisenbacteria bacterium]|nr:hypothetical protein [Candidatus Eisenbacteria bacterium]